MVVQELVVVLLGLLLREVVEDIIAFLPGDLVLGEDIAGISVTGRFQRHGREDFEDEELRILSLIHFFQHLYRHFIRLAGTGVGVGIQACLFIEERRDEGVFRMGGTHGDDVHGIFRDVLEEDADVFKLLVSEDFIEIGVASEYEADHRGCGYQDSESVQETFNCLVHMPS